MATLEDKLMGEKLQYYCSSSEDEDDPETKIQPVENAQTSLSAASKTHRSLSSENTGPKGVIQDWQKFKQLESKQREENEKQRIEMFKKLSITAKTVAEDEKQKKNEELEAELEELMNDEILLQFQKQRMAEMLKLCGQQTFGNVFQLKTQTEFLNAVEKENKHVTVIIHIYEKSITACDTLNKCLEVLANDYKMVKFCKIPVSVAGMSKQFKSNGLPAILVYKENQLIGNFVRVTDVLSDDFFPSDLESFLFENGVLPDRSVVVATY